jgi:hypothetical protein
MSMYVRAKRKNQTLFLHVEPSSNFMMIKQKIAEILNVDPIQMQLYHSDKVSEFDRLSFILTVMIYFNNRSENCWIMRQFLIKTSRMTRLFTSFSSKKAVDGKIYRLTASLWLCPQEMK